MTVTATFDGEHLRLYAGRHRLRPLLVAVVGLVVAAAVAWDWRRAW